MRRIKGQKFASYHVPLKKRGNFPGGAYFAIMPRPLYRETKPIAVIIPEPDPAETTGTGQSLAPPEGSSGPEKTVQDQFHEELIRDTHDFRQRHVRLQRPFTIISPNLEEICRVVPKVGEGVHDVYAPDGIQLARIYRTPGRFFPWPRRTRWHLEVARVNGAISLYSAPQGTISAWTLFVIFSPLWGALALFGLLAKVVAGLDAAFIWDFPARTKWRTGIFKWGLDFRALHNTYHLDAQTLDTRVAYAQAIIHSWSPD